MSVRYGGISWTRSKKLYDTLLAAALLLFLGGFIGTTLALRPEVTSEALILRGSALTAFLLLHVILCIGPLARLNRRFLPLLYNRRHLGVIMFGFTLVHAALATVQFHGYSQTNPLVSVFTAYRREYASFLSRPADLSHFPFEPMGACALVILFLMAATSHDFWLKNLGPSLWKTLHLLVFAAYGLVVGHVAWGFLQSERHPGYPLLLGIGLATVLGLHLAAAILERRMDHAAMPARRQGFVRVCSVGDLEEDRGRVVLAGGKRVALYRSGGRLYGLSNVCRHQGGPLGEGRILDGCVTCPWHGWQYRVEDGASPPPFQERVETYKTKIEGGSVFVDPRPDPPGTRTGAPMQEIQGAPVSAPPPVIQDEFYVGYFPQAPPGIGRFLRRTASLAASGALGAGLALGSLQGPLGGGDFEFGRERTFAGTLLESPVSMLLPPAGKDALILVGFGKSSIPDWARGHRGGEVRFKGSLIHRGETAMVEMNDPGSFEAPGGAGEDSSAANAAVIHPPEAPEPPAGVFTLTGELVDSKCWLGVMRPSTGKVHRACAVRCLSGGVPPALLVHREGEADRIVLLAGAAGRSAPFNPQWAGRTVRATGTLESLRGLQILRSDRIELVP
jgi:nitrite reductase/ring-hydroxylating ferredoxin subunit/DMSO/TMAO reductase YedYZ heme-binding membrane subunit